MADVKTQKTTASVKDFLDGVPANRREDCKALAKLMREITGKRPAMWGTSIVGFGSYHYRYASGREGDWPLAAFSPRKQDLTVYIMAGFDRFQTLMSKLGKHRTGKSCLYLKSLDDVHLPTLKELIKRSAAHVEKTQDGC